MKRLALYIYLSILFFVINNQCIAGGLNRIGGIGPRAGGMSGAYTAVCDDSTLFFYNPAGMSRFAVPYTDAGLEIIIPQFKYQGKIISNKSDGSTWHAMPYAAAIYPVNEKVNIGIGLTVPYAMGAKMQQDFLLPNSETLISLANTTPALSLEIADNLYIGMGINIGFVQFKHKAPLDLDGLFTPIETDNEANGFGWGINVGTMYQPTDRLTLGLTYMSELKARLNGNSNICLGPIKIEDDFDSEFTFPSRLGMGIAYQLNNKTLVSFDANWYGYSKTVDKITLRFRELPISKTNKLNWKDNFSLHLGARYKINYDWLFRCGIGYQTAAVPDETISQLTPDVSGWDIAMSIECQKQHFSFSVATIYGWGQNNVNPKIGVLYPGKYTAESLTVSTMFGWQF
jgi:long-chain fatty acid transport protein